MGAGQMKKTLELKSDPSVNGVCSGKYVGIGRQPLSVKCRAAGGLEKEKERGLELQSVLPEGGSDL